MLWRRIPKFQTVSEHLHAGCHFKQDPLEGSSLLSCGAPLREGRSDIVGPTRVHDDACEIPEVTLEMYYNLICAKESKNAEQCIAPHGSNDNDSGILRCSFKPEQIKV